MEYSLTNVRWFRIIVSAFIVIALSLLVVTLITTGYAFVLAFEARGRPDQAAVSHFAARISQWSTPLLEMFLTFFVTILATRKMTRNIYIHGVFIGILIGLLNVAVKLGYGSQLNYRSFIFFLILIGIGWLGGIVSQKRIDKKMKLPT